MKDLDKIYEFAKANGIRILRDLEGDLLIPSDDKTRDGEVVVTRTNRVDKTDIKRVFFNLPANPYAVDCDNRSTVIFESVEEMEWRVQRHGTPHAKTTLNELNFAIAEWNRKLATGEIKDPLYHHKLSGYPLSSILPDLYPVAILGGHVVIVMPNGSHSALPHSLEDILNAHGVKITLTTPKALGQSPIEGVKPPMPEVLYPLINSIVYDDCCGSLDFGLGIYDDIRPPRGIEEDDWAVGVKIHLYHAWHFNEIMRDKEYFFNELRARLGYVPCMRFVFGS